jgi:hypothetical protein
MPRPGFATVAAREEYRIVAFPLRAEPVDPFPGRGKEVEVHFSLEGNLFPALAGVLALDQAEKGREILPPVRVSGPEETTWPGDRERHGVLVAIGDPVGGVGVFGQSK